VIAPPENIEITVEDKLPVLMCEKTQIVQIFQNLINNAIKYMDKPIGQIKVNCTEEDYFWKFGVTDNGPGIHHRHTEKIFKIFQTLSPRDGIESTGIGLSIVKKLVELNNGRVWVESDVGQGSTFFFTLPKQVSEIPGILAGIKDQEIGSPAYVEIQKHQKLEK
jgi:signal transduction histidine kinase